MSRLIGIAGRAGSGKDTAGSHLVEQHGFQQYAFADPIRAMLGALGAFPAGDLIDRDAKEATIDWLGKSPRQMAQTLGTEWGRELVHPQLWVLMAQRRWDAAKAAGHSLVVTDVRFENEVEWIKAQGGHVIVLDRPSTESVSAHASEQLNFSVFADWLIFNDRSIATLKRRIDLALMELHP
jgi:hypothetical protein